MPNVPSQLVLNKPSLVVVTTNIRPAGMTAAYDVPSLWSLNGYGMAGTIDFTLLGLRPSFQPGDFCLMPPGTRRQFNFASKGLQRVVHFRFSSEVSPLPQPLPQEPQIFSSGKDGPRLMECLDRVIGLGITLRSEVFFWSFLWELHDLTGQGGGAPADNLHPALLRSTSFIATHLSRPLSVAEVVAASGVSHNHLLRLFSARWGVSVAEYLRSRRMELAAQLLASTTLPVKAVAGEVGMGDLQLFNKTFRRGYRLSPRAYRQRMVSCGFATAAVDSLEETGA